MNPITALPRRRQLHPALSLDLIERVFLLVSLGLFLSHLLVGLAIHPINIILVVSEALPVLFVLIRKPGAISSSRAAWLIAIIGTFAPLYVQPAYHPIVPAATAGMIMAIGLVISIAAKLSLNRRFGIVAANRGVMRAGAYRYVRHPMYLGYMMTHAGFLLANLSALNVAVYAIAWSAFFIRIGMEEALLAQDPAYREYRAAVRYRLLPGIY